jgi:hypothetical protein
MEQFGQVTDGTVWSGDRWNVRDRQLVTTSKTQFSSKRAPPLLYSVKQTPTLSLT